MERAAVYDRSAVKRRLIELFEASGRGTGSRLGRHVGVSATSANRWASERGDCPDPSHWPAIEEFFDLQPGDLARAGGLSRSEAPVVEMAGGHDLTAEEQAKVEAFVQGLLAARDT